MEHKHFRDSSLVMMAKFANKKTKETYEFFVSKESCERKERPGVVMYLFYPEGMNVLPKFLVYEDCLVLMNNLRSDIDNWAIMYFDYWKPL